MTHVHGQRSLEGPQPTMAKVVPQHYHARPRTAPSLTTPVEVKSQVRTTKPSMGNSYQYFSCLEHGDLLLDQSHLASGVKV